MSPRPRVVIVGAGFGGLQCAKALRGAAGRRDARRPAELPPLHAAAVPGGELPAEPVRGHRADPQGAAGRAERALPAGRRGRRRLRPADGPPRRRRHARVRHARARDGEHHQLLRQRRDLEPRARAQGSRRGAAAPQPRARLPRARRRDGRRRRAPAPAHVLHRRRRTDRRRVRGRAGRARAPRDPARVPGVPAVRRADRDARRRRPRAADVPPPHLALRARDELERLGVDVRTNTLVASADERGVVLQDGTELPTATIVWTAGVKPSVVAHHPGVTRTEQQRFAVDEHLRVIGAEHVYGIGDVAAAPDHDGSPLPMLSPPAMQAGRYVAKQIRARADAGSSATSTRARWPRSAAGRAWPRSGRSSSPASSDGSRGWSCTSTT